MRINLDGLRMNVISTAENGVVNSDTIFEFHQVGDDVWASYSGGKVVRGFLVGRALKDKLEFQYCQTQTDGALDGGRSTCELRTTDTGIVQLIEHFDWGSRPGGGTNIFEEIIGTSSPPHTRIDTEKADQ
jgi:hypothetical protein